MLEFEAAAAADAREAPLRRGHGWDEGGNAGLVGVIRPGALGVNGEEGGNALASRIRSWRML